MSKRVISLLLALLLFASASAFAAPLKIAIVTSPNEVDDGSFNTENYNGILDFIKEYPDSTVTAIQEKSGNPAECVKVLENVAADYDAVICTGFQFAGLQEVAEDNPDVKFLLVDTWPDNDAVIENVNAMKFKEEESGFFAGMAAALSSKAKKVAIVNGIAFPTNVNFQYGFMSGVNYVNRHYNTDVKIIELPSYSGTDVTGKNVGGNYVGSFVDAANGKVVGQALIREGCDVIFVAAGGAGMGVFTAAKEAQDVFVIGCDVDQYKDGVNGDKNIVLTSALKVMSMNNKRVLKDIVSGNFKGGNYLLGADTNSTGCVKTPGHHQLSDDTIAKIDAAFELVKSGKIIPSSSTSNTTPDNFTGLDVK